MTGPEPFRPVPLPHHAGLWVIALLFFVAAGLLAFGATPIFALVMNGTIAPLMSLALATTCFAGVFYCARRLFALAIEAAAQDEPELQSDGP